MKVLVLKRDVTQQECPWLNTDLKVGTTVWSYSGQVYGCISPTGIAVTAKAAETPFFEVPRNAIEYG